MKLSPPRNTPYLFIVSLLIFSGLAQAQSLPRWELGVGATLISMPDYRGADSSENYLVPYPYLIYRGEALNVDEGGIHGKLFRSDNIKLDLSIAGGPPVSGDQDGARRGMSRLAPTFEAGPSLEIRLWHKGKQQSLWFNTPARAVFSIGETPAGKGIRHQGWSLSPYLSYTQQTFGPRRWKTSVAFGPLFSDDNFHDYYYEVAPGDETATRPLFHPAGGYSGTRISAIVQHALSPTLSVAAYARYDSLKGARFIDSPLVESKHYHLAGIALTWIFAKSDEQTKVP